MPFYLVSTGFLNSIFLFSHVYGRDYPRISAGLCGGSAATAAEPPGGSRGSVAGPRPGDLVGRLTAVPIRTDTGTGALTAPLLRRVALDMDGYQPARASRRKRWVPSLLKGLSSRSSRGAGPEILASLSCRDLPGFVRGPWRAHWHHRSPVTGHRALSAQPRRCHIVAVRCATMSHRGG
jgi:hypothetical protein